MHLLLPRPCALTVCARARVVPAQETAEDLLGFAAYRLETVRLDKLSVPIAFIYELQLRDAWQGLRVRRQGYGSRLLAEVKRAGVEQGALYAMLIVHLSNKGGRAFYAARGCGVSAISPPDDAEADFEIRELEL